MKAFQNSSPTGRSQRAFTLIEMMIVVAIVAILAAIALPSYNSYIVKSEIRTAQSDLLALSLNFENQYQRQLSYPILNPNTADQLRLDFPGWSPSAKNFVYTVSVNEVSAYTLLATGSGRQSGCSITITNVNVRRTAGCRYITAGDWL